MERMGNMVSHIKMQQFSFITIYINATLYELEIIILVTCIIKCYIWKLQEKMGAMEWMVMYIILLNITCNKGCEVWATTIECQNTPIQCCALCGGQNIRDYEWYKVQTHVLKVHSVHSIHSLWKS